MTISPEVIEKLDEITKIYIKHFYKNHKEADEKVNSCELNSVQSIMRAEKNLNEACTSLFVWERKGEEKERDAIFDRLHEFHEAKTRDFNEALEKKCGCKFKF